MSGTIPAAEVMMKVLPVLFVAMIAAAPIAAAELSPEQYADAVRRETFLSEKIEIGKRYGALQTQNARKALLLLLEDDSYWNRSAAVWGLVRYADPEITKALVGKLFDDHMIDDEVEKGLQLNITLHLAGLRAIYDTETSAERRERIAAMIARSKTPQGELFVKEEFARADLPHRRRALLQLLSENYPERNYAYIRALAEDAVLRDIVLRHIVTHGDARELAYIRSVAENAPESQYRIIAFVGVARWEQPAATLDIYLRALRSQDEALQRGAITAFRDRRSPAVHDELCRLTRRGATLALRREAALELTRYRSRESVPYLITALNETQGETVERNPLMNAFLGVVSLGIIPVLEDLSRRESKRSFRSDTEDIGAALSAITMQSFGSSYSRWKEWAVLNGFTVAGENIAQRMLSGYPVEREQARQAAVRLLGYLDLNQWKEKNADHAALADVELSIALIRQLLDAKIMKDELY